MCCIGGGEEVIPETRRVGFKSGKLRGCLWLIIFFELAFYPQIYTNIWDYDKPGGSYRCQRSFWTKLISFFRNQLVCRTVTLRTICGPIQWNEPGGRFLMWKSLCDSNFVQIKKPYPCYHIYLVRIIYMRLSISTILIWLICLEFFPCVTLL